MANEITVAYRNSTVRLWDSVDVSQLQRDMITEGVANESGDGTDCKVIPTSPASASVKVKVGKVYIANVDDGLEDPHTERLYIRSERTIAVPANSTGDDRVDAIICRIDVDNEPDAESDNVGTAELILGDGNTALSDGDITAAVGSDAWYRVGNIVTPDGFTTIVAGDIVDTRLPARLNMSALFGVVLGEHGYFQGAGSSNNFTVTIPLPLPEYEEGMEIWFKANHTISGASTLNVNGISTEAIKKLSDVGFADTAPGDIANGQIVGVKWDGTNWQMISPIPTQAATEDVIGIFGNGSDGNKTLTGDDTLTRDMFYINLDLGSHTLNTAGYRVFVRGVLTGTGKIKASSGGNGGNGGNGSSSNGGAGGTAGSAAAGVTVPAGLPGKVGGAGASGLNNGGNGVNGDSTTDSVGNTVGGDGGVGGDTSSRVGGTAGTGGTSTIYAGTFTPDIGIFFARIDSGTYTQIYGAGSSGSGGGGSGNAGNSGGGGGGGSGANGGNFVVCAYAVEGSFDIESIAGNGGNGGNGFGSASQGGGGGGGGGGQGGCGFLVSRERSSWSGGFVLTGGAGGTKGTSSGTGDTQTDGTAGDDGVGVMIDV